MRYSKDTKKKILISIRKDVLENIDKFVKECDNQSINRSVIIGDVLSDFLKDKKKQNEMFPEE